jgi:tetratricopeptide (TPR) repeat protein
MQVTCAALLTCLAGAAMPAIASAEPFVPGDASLVVLQVPADPALKRLASLEAALRTDPDNTARIYALTDAYIAIGRRTGEPRYFGRAEVLLTPRLQAPSAPVELRLQLADILQYRHEYSSALEQISKALAQDRSNTRAHLMRAAIWQASGRFTQARAECGSVLAAGEGAAGSVCLAQVMGMTGQIERARLLLAQLSAYSSPSLPRYASWMLTALADLEERSGDITAAERSLRRAVVADPNDYYARFALADLLLARNRSGEVEQVLHGIPRTESVLIRMAESQSALHTRPNPYLATLTDRLDAARARGERIHARDLARVQLRLLGNPAVALRAARDNWVQQREPADARLLVECGLAAHDRSAIDEVKEWQRRTSYQDATLDALLSHAGPAG